MFKTAPEPRTDEEDVLPLLKREEHPIRIEVEMSSEAGLFQLEEVLLGKISASPAKDYVELDTLGRVVKSKEDRSEIESSKKGIRAFSIPSGDTSPLFKPPKYMLYTMALLIPLSVISPYHFPTTLGRNNYLTTSCAGCVYYLVHLIPSIG